MDYCHQMRRPLVPLINAVIQQPLNPFPSPR